MSRGQPAHPSSGDAVGIPDLVKDHAHELLLRARTLRHIRAAYDAGVPQSQIAWERGISQDRVQRLLKDTENNYEIIAERPREVIWKRAIGIVTDEEMINALAAWQYTTTQREPGTPLPESVPGTWADIENGLAEGLLTKSEVETIAGRSTII